eukprot:1151119-Pelagomonas_calceolata.AAC.2
MCPSLRLSAWTRAFSGSVDLGHKALQGQADKAMQCRPCRTTRLCKAKPATPAIRQAGWAQNTWPTPVH